MKSRSTLVKVTLFGLVAAAVVIKPGLSFASRLSTNIPQEVLLGTNTPQQTIALDDAVPTVQQGDYQSAPDANNIVVQNNNENNQPQVDEQQSGGEDQQGITDQNNGDDQSGSDNGNSSSDSDENQ